MAVNLKSITEVPEITELGDGCKVLVNNNGAAAQIDGSKLGGSKRTKELKYEWTPGLAEDGSQVIDTSPFNQEITDDVTWMIQPSDEYEVVCEMDIYALETTNVVGELKLIGSFNVYSTYGTTTMSGVQFVMPTGYFATQIITSGEASMIQGSGGMDEGDTAIKAIRLYKLTY